MDLISKYITYVDKPLQPIEFNNSKEGYSVTNLLDEFDKYTLAHGLLIGQVQSGKTRRIIEIIQYAIQEYRYDYVFCLGGTNSALTEQSAERIGNEISGRCYEEIVENQEYPSKTVFVLMKQKDALTKMLSFITNHCESKILIIDDESDFGSVNTKEYRTPSKINELITESYLNINAGGLLSVTATPFANLINSQNEIPTKFVWTLPINPSYTGLDFFNGLKNFYITDMSWFNDSIVCSDKAKCEFSIYVWLIKTYWMFKLEDNIHLSDLLIYVSNTLEDHQRLSIQIGSILRNLNFDQQVLDQFCEHLNVDHINIEDMKQFYSEVGTPEILVLNGQQKDWRETLNLDKDHRKPLRIIIGGVFLSRGVTYPHLTTELFTCLGESISVDTLLQKCRWFGYRRFNNRYKYMNVITTPRIANALLEVVKDYNQLFTQKLSGQALDPLDLQTQLRTIDEELKDLNIKGTSNAKGK